MSSSDMRDRPVDDGAERAPTITPEMIAAGVEAYANFDSRDRASYVVEAIYEAMFRASPSSASPHDP